VATSLEWPESASSRAHLGAGQHHGQALGELRRRGQVELAEIDREDIAVQEQQRRECLVLRRGAHAALHREVREEGLDLGAAHVGRVALAVEQDEASDPADVGFFGAAAAMERAHRGVHTVEQPRRRGLGQRSVPGTSGVSRGV